MQGSSTLYPQLFAENLVDRLTILTFPVVLGKGRRLFGEGTPPFAMKMVNSEVSTTGVTIATYEPSGNVPVGTFLEDTPSEAELKRRERWAQEG
nr:dihydrofolate reductase family protein [Bdellovibrio bacteriovorus]